MVNNKSRISVALASVVIATSIFAPPATASAAGTPTGDCTPAAQQSGDCLGFSTFSNGNPYAAAVASALATGQVRKAQHFVKGIGHSVSTAVRTELTTAVSSAKSPAAASKAASRLFAAASRATTLGVTPASVPAQAGNGETAATGYYGWLLHNDYHVPVYYGTCSSYSGSCTWYGSWDFTLSASTFDVADYGMHWSGQIHYRSGLRATLSGVHVQLFRDITGSPDTHEATLGCATGGSSFDCSGWAKAGNVVGHWYYMQLDETTTPTGHPASTFQVQTRRYEVLQAQNWQFLSYQYYGN